MTNNSTSHVRQACSDALTVSIPTLLIAGLLTWFSTMSGGALELMFAGGAIAFLCVGPVMLYFGITQRPAREEKVRNSQAAQWVRAAGSQEEHEHRQAKVEALGVVAALEEAGLTPVSYFDPVINVDGSPMIGGVDIHGNSFGVTTFSDDDSGSGLGGYSPPIGRDDPHSF